MLLERVRRLTGLLGQEGLNVAFNGLASALGEALDGAGVCVVSRTGKVLGWSFQDGAAAHSLVALWVQQGRIPPSVHAMLAQVGEPLTGAEAQRILGREGGMIVPIRAHGQDAGTLLLLKTTGTRYNYEDQLLAELAAVALGLAIAREREARRHMESRQTRAAERAVRTLSYSELRTLRLILNHLPEGEGVLVAGKVALQAGLTRSVVIKTLRKLSSANVIASRSVGVKGTYVRILNPAIGEVLAGELPGNPRGHLLP